MKEKMGMKGVKQGDMAPDVKDYQRKGSAYTEHGFSKTTDYIERKDKHEAAAASKIKGQAYKGRYE